MRHKLPAIMFYFGDWFKATDVRMCSLEARGLWIDLLGLMWEGDNPGYLSNNGRPLKVTFIGRVIGESEEKVKVLLNELEENGVFSKTEDETIFCRRMVKDIEKRNKCAVAGKKGGGNPLLTFKGEVKGEVKGVLEDEYEYLREEKEKKITTLITTNDGKEKSGNGNIFDFKIMTSQEYVKLLKSKIQLKGVMSFEDIFKQFLHNNSKDTSNDLEVIIQHLIKWAYKESIDTPLQAMQSILTQINMGKKTINLLTKDELYERIGEHYDAVIEKWEREWEEKLASPEYKRECQIDAERQKIEDIEGPKRLKALNIHNPEPLQCLENMKARQKQMEKEREEAKINA